MRFIAEETDVQMIMWEKTLMPESKPEKDEKGKTQFVKTGNKVEMTTYTLRDGFGDKLVLLSSNNNFRTLEGKKVNVTMEIKFDEFNRKNKLTLAGIEEIKESKK